MLQTFVAIWISFLFPSFISTQDVIWEHLEGYTCDDLTPAIGIFSNVSHSQCRSLCLSANYSMECTSTTWYEYIKQNSPSRCFLLGKTCELITDNLKPVTTSFWYHNITNNLNCVDYPSNWKDNYFDTCDDYSKYKWCESAYNSSTTAILSYQDTINGFDALKVCCECNGGLFIYDDTYVFEAKWKPTSKLNIYEDPDGFICRSSTSIDRNDILVEDQLNLTQFIGLCEQLHSRLYDKYELLLSINTENNNVLNSNDIATDFMIFKEFDCANNVLLSNVTICNETDYNNVYPFIIDLEQNHVFINNHYINAESFLYHLPPTYIQIEAFCEFSVLLETIYPTNKPTEEPTTNPTQISLSPTSTPTFNPTSQPTKQPTLNPSTNPIAQPTMTPTQPTTEPTTDPITEPTIEPTVNPTSTPTFNPTRQPTKQPTLNPSTDPIAQPTMTPTQPTTEPTTDPTTEPTIEPTTNPIVRRRRLRSDSSLYFKTNIIAVLLCDTRYTAEPTIDPTSYPTLFPSILTPSPTVTSSIITAVMTTDTSNTLDNDENNSNSASNSGNNTGAIVVGILFICCIWGLLCGLLYYFKFKYNLSAEALKPHLPSLPPAAPAVEMETNAFEEEERKYDHIDDDFETTFKYKRIQDWTNNEILNWVKSMRLGDEWSNIILNVIASNNCTGADICALSSSEDVEAAFDIENNKTLCKRIYQEITSFKPQGKEKHDAFTINIFSSGKYMTLDQEVTQKDTVRFVKSLFKIQLLLFVDVEHIHFKCNNKELSSRKTLKKCGITNSDHLITVEMDDVFSININSQQSNIVLNEKVTKKCTVNELKEMYKDQSDVKSNIADIHFYYKSKLLDAKKTLEQVGIVDEKHLISVKFGADGGAN